MSEKHQIIEAHTLEDGEVEMHMNMPKSAEKLKEMVINGEKEVVVIDTKNSREVCVLGEEEVKKSNDSRTERNNDELDEI